MVESVPVLTNFMLPQPVERLTHNPPHWIEIQLEAFFPKVEKEHLTKLEGLVANALEYAEVSCGIVADLTGSSPRRMGQDNTLMDQAHGEFLDAASQFSPEDDWTIGKLRNGPDIDLKIRESDYLPVRVEEGKNVPDTFEFILFGTAHEHATRATEENNGNVFEEVKKENGYVVAWKIDESAFIKVKTGRVPDGANRRYCAIELHEGCIDPIGDKEPEGNVLAEIHMGYEPTNNTENKADRRAGGTVSDYMKLKIRLRGRDGKLLSHTDDVERAKARLQEPDNGGVNSYEKGSIAQYLERTFRELRAEIPFVPVEVKSLEDLLLLAASPDLWRSRRELLEHIVKQGYGVLDREVSGLGSKIASLLTAEQMIIGEVDPWSFIMFMANSGLIEVNQFFRGRINVSTFHEWLTSDPLTELYVSDAANGDPRNHRDVPLYQRNASHIMSERQAYLRNRHNATIGGQMPSSGLMMLERIFEHRPGETGERLTEDSFLQFMMYYFNLQPGKGFQHYVGFPMQFGDIGFKSYENYFGFMTRIVKDKLPFETRKEIVDQFDYAVDVLKEYVVNGQATFNMLNLTTDPLGRIRFPSGEVFFGGEGITMPVERLFTSGVLTRIGKERAMFTSPRVVSSIWSVRPTQALETQAENHLTQQIETAYEELTGTAQKEVVGAMSEKHIRKPVFLAEVKRTYRTQMRFPNNAAVLYYEPPQGLVQGMLLYEAHKIKRGTSRLVRGEEKHE